MGKKNDVANIVHALNKKSIPIICILWMKIEHKNEISTLKDNNLKHETMMQSSKFNSEGSTEMIRTTKSTI